MCTSYGGSRFWVSGNRSLFSQCEICKNLKEDLSNKALSFDQKLGALQLYRAHLHDQFCDRSICWRLQSEGADPSTDLLVIATDGLDQAKFALPRDPNLRSSAYLILAIYRTLLDVISLFYFYWIFLFGDTSRYPHPTIEY